YLTDHYFKVDLNSTVTQQRFLLDPSELAGITIMQPSDSNIEWLKQYRDDVATWLENS
uniref:Aminopeptidase A (Fragments) n=1 Tax=Gloydius blomhoffii TaxID=242054 RepID=AMPE_GLOBL|nr:RecName: Full=Aminopeptidase A; Short=AP-A; Short=APA; AltName: Full=Glutamyl aminopeptidase; Short=EAP [Gloydius blomhoffii]